MNKKKFHDMKHAIQKINFDLRGMRFISCNLGCHIKMNNNTSPPPLLMINSNMVIKIQKIPSSFRGKLYFLSFSLFNSKQEKNGNLITFLFPKKWFNYEEFYCILKFEIIMFYSSYFFVFD